MLVHRQDQDPATGVLCDEEVDQGEGDGVAGEHVVTTCSHSL